MGAAVRKGLGLVAEARVRCGVVAVAANLVSGSFGRHRHGDGDHVKTLDVVYAIFPRQDEGSKK